jgi:hypothetical protein
MDTLLMRPTAGRMETRQQQRLQRALGGPAGPGFMGRRRENVREMGQAISRGFTRAVTVAGERLRAIQTAAATAATSLRTFAGSVLTASRAALIAAVSFTKASAIAIGQAIKRGGARLLSAPMKAITAARTAATGVAAGQTTARGTLGKARAALTEGFRAREPGTRRGLGRLMTPLDTFQSGYDKSMRKQGDRAVRTGRHSGRVAKGRVGAGRVMDRGLVGRQVAGGLGKSRALSRGIFTVFSVAIKKAILFALGAFTGAGLVFTIPLMLAFGAAFMANPEQFKKYMLETFKAPLEALKKTWDDTTAVFRRLFAAIKSGGDGEGSKFVEWAGRITGILATALGGAIQFVLTLVNFLFEGFHVLFLLMSGEGAMASELLSRAFLRLRVGMAEVFASLLELVAKIPGIKQLFGGALESGAASIRSWASETRAELARADIIPNAIAMLQNQEKGHLKALRQTRDVREENLEILADLVKFSIIEQETIDRLVDSVNDLSTAFLDIDTDLGESTPEDEFAIVSDIAEARVEMAGAAMEDAEARVALEEGILALVERRAHLEEVLGPIAADGVLSLRQEAILREENLDLALNEIAAMEMLTDEQKVQLAYRVMQADLTRSVAEREAAAAEMAEKLTEIQRGGTKRVNVEKEKGLALVYLEAQLVDAMRRGDTEAINAIKDRIKQVKTNADAEQQALAIAQTFDQQRIADRERENNLLDEANKHIAMKVQLNERQQAQYDALKEEMEEMLELEKDRLNFFKSAMGEVMSDIGSAVDRVVNKQTEAIKRLFDEIEDVTNDYFSNFSEEFQKSIDGLRDAVIEQAEEEEAYIDYLSDLAIQKIEDEREMEKKLEQERQLYFAREKARIDFLAGRRTGAVQVEEAMARGDVGQAAVLQIRMQTDAQQYYADQLQENEDRLMQLREEARDSEIERINAEREVAKEIVGIRRDAAEQDLDNAQEIAMTEMELAQQAARARMDEAKGAIDKMIESEGFLRSEFLREWNRVTPATEEEYRRHLSRLEDFMNESDERMVELTNKIKDEMGQDLAEISQGFGLTVTEVVGDLDTAMQAAGFAVEVFGQDLARTTANTLLSVLTAFEGFNVGLEQGYANAVALAEAFFEMFQRSVDQAVEWARGLADRMLAEDMKWKQAGEEAGRQFREEFERQMRELEAAAARTAARMASMFDIFGDITGMLDDFVPGSGRGEGFSNRHRRDPGLRDLIPPRAIPDLTNEGETASTPRTFQPTTSRDFEGTAFDPNITGDALVPRAIRAILNYVHQSPERSAFRQETQQMRLETLDPVDRARMQLSQNPYNRDATTEYMMAMMAAGMGNQRVSLGGGSVTPQQYLRGQGLEYHTGGLVGGLKGSEVPAILEKGEYVIQRSAVSALGVDFLNSLNSSSAMFSVPEIRNLNVARPAGDSTVNSTNTYNLSFNVDGGNIDEQQLAQKVVFEIKKMERAGGGGRRV